MSWRSTLSKTACESGCAVILDLQPYPGVYSNLGRDVIEGGPLSAAKMARCVPLGCDSSERGEPMNFRIFIGWDSSQRECAEVLAYSLRKYASLPLEIRFLQLAELGFDRPWDPLQSTEFTYTR